MTQRTGAFRYRVGGIFRHSLVLQLEFEHQRLVSTIGWPPRYAPERYWRDATLEDLTAEPRTAPIPSPTWSETRPATGSGAPPNPPNKGSGAQPPKMKP
ncbi:MAG: hypothetical protein FD144_2655 [Rhodospirillaceae bacterium]|nr:MAG: hypothetical protein FD144_2655 [Rhodospirillaceae bacterium]